MEALASSEDGARRALPRLLGHAPLRTVRVRRRRFGNVRSDVSCGYEHMWDERSRSGEGRGDGARGRARVRAEWQALAADARANSRLLLSARTFVRIEA